MILIKDTQRSHFVVKVIKTGVCRAKSHSKLILEARFLHMIVVDKRIIVANALQKALQSACGKPPKGQMLVHNWRI